MDEENYFKLAELETRVEVLKSVLVSILLAGGPAELTKEEIDAGLDYVLEVDATSGHVILTVVKKSELKF